MTKQDSSRQQAAVSEIYRPIDWKQPVAVAIFAMLIIFARMPDRVIFGFLWGEDGKIFLQQAYENGLGSIFTPYAQYLHLVPRLIAYAYSKIGRIDHAARPLMWISTLALCATCAYLFTFARKTLPLPGAIVFGLAPLLVPHSGEVWLTITNEQWVIAPVLLVLLWDEFCLHSTKASRASGDIIRGGTIAAITLTGPFGLLFTPVVVTGLFMTRKVHRSRRAWAAIGAYFIAVGFQLVSILRHLRPTLVNGLHRAPTFSYLYFPWAKQFLKYFALDYSLPGTWIARMGLGWHIAAVICVCVIFACVALCERRYRAGALALCAIAIALWMIGVIRAGTPQIDLKWDGYGGRYFYVPFVLLTWAIVLSVAKAKYGFLRFAGIFLLSCALLNSAAEFQSPVWAHSGVLYRDDSHQWQLIVPPSPDWSVDLRPEWIGKNH